ncbi:Hsp70 family protein [Gordonia sp. HNM0687]|uniref:Hsp70 family protein n=1 Tax=Gordonia mangrovi TaxID=2665643 RepID=A0A6L7GTM4_9ACTN|nr:Hsp70 family protein [Gordonia mangrovi]MXP21858.1 Hsp70 family protein [Gordonia mangrovi]UVF76229.1 Hsp70 family protein [Gordonia mangrovi]
MTATGLGISIGTSLFRSSTYPIDSYPDHARASILTLVPHLPPEVGTRQENPRVSDGGMTIRGFVERVGDPIPLTTPDGGTHDAQALTAHAIRSVMRGVADRFDGSPSTVIAHPAHWPDHTVATMRAALGRNGLRHDIRIESDMYCAVERLRDQPDFPAAGLLAVVDVGASGSSVAVLELGSSADGAERPDSAPADVVRLERPSGADLDHAILQHVLGQVLDPASVSTADVNLTDAIRGVRAQCRRAKEELSQSTVSVVDVDLPGFRGDIRVTRNELDDLLGEQLAPLDHGISEALDISGRQASDLVAIAAIGGGANIGAMVHHLSGHFHVPVLVDPDPGQTAARGAALIAARSARRPAPVVGPAAGAMVAAADAEHTPARPPATPSNDASTPTTRQFRPATLPPTAPLASGAAGPAAEQAPDARSARPVLEFIESERRTEADGKPGNKRRAAIVAVAALAVLGAVSATAFAVARDGDSPPTPPPVSTSAPTTSTSEQVEEATRFEQAPAPPLEPQVTTPDPTDEPGPSISTPIDTETDSGTGTGTDPGTGSGTDPGTDPGGESDPEPAAGEGTPEEPVAEPAGSPSG